MSKVSVNPFRDFRRECELVLSEALKRTLPETIISDKSFKEKVVSPRLEVPSSPFGDLASSICLEIARRLKITPQQLADKVIANSNLKQRSLVKGVKAMGGYINFQANNTKLTELTLESARSFAESYGHVSVASPMKVIVEHTSVNPVGPIHVGTARNSIIGDSLSRLLKARGHEVSRHFYVDDVGRQSAVLAYGYNLMNRPKPKGKADHWIGLVYAITSCIIEIERLKRELKELESNDATHERANEARLDLDGWVSAAAELQEKDSPLFEDLLEGIKRDVNPEKNIAAIIRLYEGDDSKIKSLVREVADLCINGFRKTYDKVGIYWDSWDWESDLVWSSAVSDVLNRLRRTRFHTTKEGTSALDVDAAADEMHLKKRFGVPEDHEIPPMVLARSDGTTLYSSRDIAYSLWKLARADKVINVIGMEQSLAQLQIRIALAILVSVEKAEGLTHYAYELVTLPGYKMSKRRGRYITFDEILEEAKDRALKEVEKRSPDLSLRMKENISEKVGVGAVKYALIDVAPSKQVVFTWDKVLNFEMNSAPFIQYAYARASNILDKAEKKALNPNYALLKEPVELELVRKIALYPETFIAAADNLTPSLLTEFVYSLAASFNSFYATIPVLKAEPQSLRDARLAMVDAVKITLKNAFDLLGIEVMERM